MNKGEFLDMIFYLTKKIDIIVNLPEKEYQDVLNCMKVLIETYQNYEKRSENE